MSLGVATNFVDSAPEVCVVELEIVQRIDRIRPTGAAIQYDDRVVSWLGTLLELWPA